MARPFKSGIDYFPLNVALNDKVILVEAEHGVLGFGIFIKLYQKVYASNYWINWDKKAEIVFSKSVSVNINEVNAIINSCVEWEIFDKKLFEKDGVLTSIGIQKRFFEIVKRRKKVEITEKYLLVDLNKYFTESEIKTRIFIVNADNNPVNESSGTQSKGKESKGEESIKKPNKINKPENVTEQTWNDFLTHRKSKKASVTQTVINTFSKQAKLAGMSLEEALIETISRGWVGFKAEWVKNKPQNSFKKTESRSLSQIIADKKKNKEPVFDIEIKAED